MITYPCQNFSGSFAKPPLKLLLYAGIITLAETMVVNNFPDSKVHVGPTNFAITAIHTVSPHNRGQ